MRTLLVAVAGVPILAVPAAAQGGKAPGHQRSPIMVANHGAPVAPFADPDTTRNIISHGPYTTPGECLAAVVLAHRELVRDPSRDTLPGSQHVSDTLPPAVRAVGAQCLTQFPLATVAPRELENMFDLAVMMYDTVASAAALDRWLALPQMLADSGESLAETRAKRLSAAIRMYLADITGPQMATDTTRARTLFARLEALGPSVLAQRIGIRSFMLDTELGWAEQAGHSIDPHRVLRDYTAVLAGIDSAGGSRLPVQYGANMGNIRARLLWAQLILDSRGSGAFADSLAGTLSSHLAAFSAFLQARAHSYSDQFGQLVTTPLKAQFWYNAQGDTLWPVPGHVSLLVMDSVSIEEVPRLRRLAARYGPHGLRITLVEETKGYWIRSGTETGPRTAAQEAAQDSAYYLDYLKLPVTLAIVEGPSVPYASWRENGPLALVDATGHLMFNTGGMSETFLNAYLDRVLGLSKP